MSKSIAVIVGTRPEVIKMAPVFRALSDLDDFEVTLVSTGQHREMVDQALGAFGLVPDIDLDVMKANQSLSELTSRVLTGLSGVYATLKPDAVLVQGDTTSVLAASLAAFYSRIPVGHVEAGMRTGNLSAPWPEEMNRRLTAQLVHWHFAPLDSNVEHLMGEGILKERCFVTGNTIVDALLWMRTIVEGRTEPIERIRARLGISQQFFEDFLIDQKAPLILVTGHRRESFGEGIANLCDALQELVRRWPSIGILYPVHLNPAVRDVVKHRLGGSRQIELVPPLNYQDFVWAMERSTMIISDSGGIQGESSTLRKPLLVTRDTTEYPESILGGSRLVGTRSDSIVAQADLLLRDRQEYQRRSQCPNPFGDGRAAERIATTLSLELLGQA